MMAMLLVFSVVATDPVIDAIDDQEIYAGDTFSYQVVANDDADGGSIVSYEIDEGPATMTIDESTGLIEWVTEASDRGTDDVEIDVEDDQGEVEEVSFEIEVLNNAPVMDDIADQTADDGHAFTVDISASDVDGDGLAFSLEVLDESLADVTSDFTLTDNGDGTGTVTYSTPVEGTYTVTVTVTDDYDSATDDESFTLTVEANDAPVLSSISDQTADRNVEFTVSGSASDSEGDIVGFSLSAEDENLVDYSSYFTITNNGDNTFDITWTSPLEGNYTVNVTADDGFGGTDEVSFALEVYTNIVPTIDAIEDQSIAVEHPFSYQTNATDGNDDTLTYSLTSGPAAMTIDSNGLIELADPYYGEYDVTVLVEDGYDSVEESFVFTVVENSAPVFTSVPAVDANDYVLAEVAVEFTFDFEAEDADEDTLTFSLDDYIPSGMVIDSTTGEVSGWVPDPSEEGDMYELEVVVEDAYGGRTTHQMFLVVVIAGNDAPVITTIDDQDVKVDMEFTYQVVATDADGDELTYSLELGPADMVINSTTGEISGWTPDISLLGTTDYARVAVDDGNGGVSYESFYLTVVENSAPVITTIGDQTAIVSDTFSYQVVATDEEGEELTYALSGEPTDMTIDSATGLIEWVAVEGTYTITVGVLDTYGNAVAEDFTLTVSLNQAPVMDAIGTQAVVYNEAFSHQVTASDPEGHTLSYSLSGEPSGMTVDANGLVSWSAAVEGTYTVTVTVTDSYGDSDSEVMTLVVSNVLDVLEIELENIEQEIEDIEDEMEDVEEDAEEYWEDFNEAFAADDDDDMDDASDDLEDLEDDEWDALEERVEQLEEDLEDLEDQLDDVEETDENEDDIEDFEDDIDEYFDDVEKLTNELDELLDLIRDGPSSEETPVEEPVETPVEEPVETSTTTVETPTTTTTTTTEPEPTTYYYTPTGSTVVDTTESKYSGLKTPLLVVLGLLVLLMVVLAALVMVKR